MKDYKIEYFLGLDEDDRYKEVYALFGSCVYHFQVLEHQLINMIMLYYKSKNITLQGEEYDNLFSDYSDKTMGKLIEKVITIYSLNEETRKLLWQIHTKRNFFIHHYFKNRNKKMINDEGKIELINEINEVDNQVIDLDEYLTKIMSPYVEKIGITEEIIDYFIDKMKEGVFIDDLDFPE